MVCSILTVFLLQKMFHAAGMALQVAREERDQARLERDEARRERDEFREKARTAVA